jgi:hypothetical protein
VIGWPPPRRLSHLTMNHMDMSYLATLVPTQAQAMLSVTRASSQRYMPHYLAIRKQGSTQSACAATPGGGPLEGPFSQLGSITGRENRR